MKVEKMILNEVKNVTLTAWISEVGGEFFPIEKRPAILILPGGGYSMCSDREAEPVAAAYLNAGFQTFILRYSVKEHKAWPNPLNDYEQAMSLIRENADKWHVDGNRVAVVGFSAGGHLAACAATTAKNRPNAAILGYAALKKEICDMCQPGMPYPVDCVDDRTPACFLFSTRDDNIVDIRNTLDFEKALVEKGISFESHIYSYGMHGFSTGAGWLNQTKISRRTRDWVEDSVEWLDELWGAFTTAGFTASAFDRMVNADHAEHLSAGCTIAHLRKQKEEVLTALEEALAVIDGFIATAYNNAEVARQAVEGYKLSDALMTLQVPADKVLEIDGKLKNFQNER